MLMLDLAGGRISAEDVGYGYGFRLNYHQTIAKKTIGTTDYYEYTDADGTRCYFYYDSEKKEWKDELGKDLTLKVNGSTSKEPYVIEGKDHSRMVFGKAGHLIRITDQNANQITVTFGKGDGKITAVTDGAGRVAKLAYFTDADGKQTRVKTLTAPDGRVWGFAYTDGKLTAVTDPDGKKSTYAYDSKKLLTSVKNFDGYELRYTYDTRSPYRVKKIAEYAGETAGKSLSLTYGYNSTKFTDNKNRSEIYRFNNSGNLREERGYDYTTDPISGTPKKLTTAVMDEKWKDKLLKWGSTEMTYDACGNMLKKGDTTFTWTQGRKLSAINNGKNIRYYYDHTGARVKKVVDGVTTEYRMAGSLLVSERTGDETIWYQYDSAASLVAMIIGGTRYNYVRNAQNDIVGLIDSTGKRVVYYKYDSWGRAVNISGTMAATVGQKNPFRYRGYYFDAESGMYYLQSRYYDPEIRRFISADDYGLLSASNTVYDKNLYAYGDGNPIIRLDASGRIWETIFDIVSLGDSIWQTVMEPADPWNWIGLVGDTIDLIPVVTGVGEAVRAVKTIDRIDTAADTVSTVRKGWKVGDDITTVTKAGKSPAWSTVKSRYWKNEAYYRPDQYSLRNLPRMRAGRAPLVQSKSGKYYPMELHHTIPRRNGGGHYYSNLEQVAPWQHAKIDKYRHFKE